MPLYVEMVICVTKVTGLTPLYVGIVICVTKIIGLRPFMLELSFVLVRLQGYAPLCLNCHLRYEEYRATPLFCFVDIMLGFYVILF